MQHIDSIAPLEVLADRRGPEALLEKIFRTHGVVEPGFQKLGVETVFRPRKRMSSFFLLKWGVQILCLFSQNQTPRSDSANLEPSEPIFYPQILEPRPRPAASNTSCPALGGTSASGGAGSDCGAVTGTHRAAATTSRAPRRGGRRTPRPACFAPRWRQHLGLQKLAGQSDSSHAPPERTFPGKKDGSTNL